MSQIHLYNTCKEKIITNNMYRVRGCPSTIMSSMRENLNEHDYLNIKLDALIDNWKKLITKYFG